MNVKICGLTRVEDVRLATGLGATHVGFVIAVPDSPRSVEVAAARSLVCAAGVATPVLVFRRPEADSVCDAARALGVSTVQVHCAAAGTLAALRARGLEVWEAIDATRCSGWSQLPTSRTVVLDVGEGGSGRTFDWTRLAPRAPERAFVAGGVSPANVRRLVGFEPYGIDVSSGIEAEPGVKDPLRLRALFDAIGEAVV